MIHLISSEFRKLWGKRIFWLMILALAGIQLCVLLYQNSHTELPIAACHNLDAMLSTMTEEEKNKFIIDCYNRIEGVSIVEEVHMYETFRTPQGKRMAESCKKENQETYDNYLSVWKAGSYLMFTNTLEEEHSFLEAIYKRWKQTNDYEAYLEEIIAKGNMQSGISIFAGSEKEEGYSAKSIHKTVGQYSTMSGVKTDFYTYEWVERLLSMLVSDLMFLVSAFVLAGVLIYDEKKKNLLGVIRTTPLGRVPCITAKLISLAGSLLFVEIIIYLESMIYFALTGGLYGLGNAVQSVYSLVGVPWRLSVLEYLLLVFLGKYVTVLIFALILVFLTILVGHFGWVFLVGGIEIAGSVVLYVAIPAPSVWNWFHYCNFWSFLQIDNILSEYSYLNWFGNPIAISTVFMVIVVGVGLVFLWFNIIAFVGRGVATLHHAVRVKEIVPLQCRKRRTPAAVLLLHECHHFFWRNRGLWIVLAFLWIVVVQAIETKHYQTPNEVHYRQRMEELKGTLTREKEKSILEEKEHYVAIYEQLTKINKMFARGEITEEECEAMKAPYHSQLAFVSSFQRVYQRYLYVKAHPQAEFVYEDGYFYLLGKDGSGNLSGLLQISMVLILLLSPVLSVEQEKGLIKLIHATTRGRSDWYCYRIGISLAVTATLYFIWFGKNLYETMTYYGVSSFGASVISLAGLVNFPSWMPVWLLVLLCAFWQLLCVEGLASLILLLSAKTGNTVVTVLLSATILLLPLVLALLGLDFMKYVSVYPFFCGEFWLVEG